MNTPLKVQEPQSSNESHSDQPITSKIYSKLIRAHEAAFRFISELGELRQAPLPETLLAHCKDLKLPSKSSAQVVQLMESRMNKYLFFYGRMLKNNKLKKNWSEDDLQILLWFMGKYIRKNCIQSHQNLEMSQWEQIAELIPGSTARSCMFKFVSLRKFKLAQHKWQKDEENLLLDIISNWKSIAETLYQRLSKKKIFRTAKQCREHWSCYLNPSIKKGPWDREQDKKLLRVVMEGGCLKRWSVIKEEFEGRTENALKNRYNLLLEKQKKTSPSSSQRDLILSILKQPFDQTPRRDVCLVQNAPPTEAQTFSNHNIQTSSQSYFIFLMPNMIISPELNSNQILLQPHQQQYSQSLQPIIWNPQNS